MKYSKIMDKDSEEIIKKQIKRIKAGADCAPFHFEFKKQLKDILSVKLKAGFTDMFVQTELVKVKFFCSAFENEETMIYEIDKITEKLLKLFRIKQVSYLDDDDPMIVIWM